MKKVKLTKNQLKDAYQGLREGGVEFEKLSAITTVKVKLPNGTVHKKGSVSFHPLAKPYLNDHKSKPKWNYETKQKINAPK